jgi:uncharacterized protein (DUF302 family)
MLALQLPQQFVKGNFSFMKAVSAGQTYVIAERFDRAVKLIRGALSDVELDVVREFDVAMHLNVGSARKAVPSRILFVDCPLLAFEALALDRAAGVFLPLHILVSSRGDRTEVFVANPTALLDVRLPVGAAAPIARLHARAALALESALLAVPGQSSSPEVPEV